MARLVLSTPDTLAQSLTERLGARVQRDVAFKTMGTYRLGGPLAVFVRAESVDDLLAVAEVTREQRPRVLVFGRGSNLLVADAGFPGLGLQLGGDLEAVEIDDVRVTAGGAAALPVLARRSAAAGRTGLEFYVGIPGSVGGAVRMNAGGHGRQTSDVLTRAWAIDLLGAGELVEHSVESLDFAYRRSALRRAEVVVRAEFAVGSGDVATGKARIDDIVKWRRDNQPGGANAGSVFRNPPDDSAGRLIEAAGLKGFRIGGAFVSDKHANFFQADAGATAADVQALVLHVRSAVETQFGVRLVPELQMIGFEERER
jgi:UDP-N-acetylmuramate dehydrogenase